MWDCILLGFRNVMPQANFLLVFVVGNCRYLLLLLIGMIFYVQKAGQYINLFSAELKGIFSDEVIQGRINFSQRCYRKPFIIDNLTVQQIVLDRLSGLDNK